MKSYNRERLSMPHNMQKRWTEDCERYRKFVCFIVQQKTIVQFMCKRKGNKHNHLSKIPSVLWEGPVAKQDDLGIKLMLEDAALSAFLYPTEFTHKQTI